MYAGIYFSTKENPKVTQALSRRAQLKVVATLTLLKKELFKNEFDFVYVDEKNASKALGILSTVSAMDADMAFLSPHDYGVLSYEKLYRVNEADIDKSLCGWLSFHRAFLNGRLQSVFRGVVSNQSDDFYLVKNLPLGIVLADAEGKIFYYNESAAALLHYVGDREFLRDYLPIGTASWVQTQTDNLRDELMPVIDTDLSVLVTEKKIFSAKIYQGSIYYLQDVCRQDFHVHELLGEKEKFERLSLRLNDMLLKDTQLGVYQMAYIKRKIEVEILHAKKGMGVIAVAVVSLAVQNYGKLLQKDKKALLVKFSQEFAEYFPEPNIVGIVADGHWIVIVQNPTLQLDTSLNEFAAQTNTYLKVIGNGTCKLVQHVWHDLAQYEDFEALLAEL